MSANLGSLSLTSRQERESWSDDVPVTHTALAMPDQVEVEPIRPTPSSAHTAWFGDEVRALARLGAPLIGAQLAQISINFVDTVMAGHLGAVDLAAVSMGGVIFYPVMVIGLGMCMAVSPSVAQLCGAGRRAEVANVVRQGLWMALLLAGTSFVAIRAGRPLLEYFEVDPRVVPLTVTYLAALSWGMPAVVLFNVLRSYCEGMGRTGPILWISLIALPVNMAGNYAFGFGAWGFPKLGSEGLGYASAITMWVMFIGLALFARWHPDLRADRLFARWVWPRWPTIGHLVWVGGPIGVSLFFECTLFGVVALILGKLGPEVVSANQIALNLASVTFMIPLGLAMAVTVRVGRAIGAGDNAAARRTGFVGNVLCVGFMSCAALAMALFPDWLTALYTNDPQVLVVARQLLFCAAIFQVFDGLQVSGAGALRGLKDTRAPMLITVIAYWCVGIPIGYHLGVTLDWGPQGLWTGLIGSLVAAATLLNTRFYLRVGHATADAHSPTH